MNFLPHQLLGINFDRSNNLNVLFVFFLLSSTYFSGLSSSFRLLISFVHVLFLFLFTQVLQNTKAKCLCANLVTGCFLVSFFLLVCVCLFVRCSKLHHCVRCLSISTSLSLSDICLNVGIYFL
jgi:hypothetical protein